MCSQEGRRMEAFKTLIQRQIQITGIWKNKLLRNSVRYSVSCGLSASGTCGCPSKKFRLIVYVVPGPKEFHEYTLKIHQEFRGKFFLKYFFNLLFFQWNFHEISRGISWLYFFKFKIFYYILVHEKTGISHGFPWKFLDEIIKSVID